MTLRDWIGYAVVLVVLAAVAGPLGRLIVRVVDGARDGTPGASTGRIGRLWRRAAGAESSGEQTAARYLGSFLTFHLTGIVALYALQRAQPWMGLNPEGFAAPSPDLAWNAAVSFVTNTNWQSYGGESTFGYAVQAGGFGVQNFLSAASGLAVMFAVARSLVRERSTTIGNFWRDLARSVVFVLLPLSVVLALVSVANGVPQTLDSYHRLPALDLQGGGAAAQTVAVGPVASQIAIKQLGTNGGGFFNANSAHPFENPTPFTNLLHLLAILLIPAACCGAFGELVKDRRQGRALLVVMLVLFVPCLVVVATAEAAPDEAVVAAGGDGGAGNLEGKEVRHGVAASALWATATTAASNGSVNSMHESYTPLGALMPLWLMQIGEVVFGGVGSGLYGMLLFVVAAVFLGGLMVGRTPEYLGKKIESFEMKAAAIGILAPSAAVLIGTAVAVATEAGRAGVGDSGPRGFSEILYAFSSAGNNNGSAFAGLSANTPFYNVALGLAMLVGRFGVAVPVLLMAGSLAAKKKTPPGAGTLPTHGPLFMFLLAATVVAVGALTFIPALALGPIAEACGYGR